MPWKHRWLTKNWDDVEWHGWEVSVLRIIYLTVCMPFSRDLAICRRSRNVAAAFV